MSEYRVQWRHLRYPEAIDDYYYWWVTNQISIGLAEAWIAQEEVFTARQFKNGIPIEGGTMYLQGPSSHGGKTECRIFTVTEPLPEIYPTEYPTPDVKLVATGEAICSWRDQFDRRVGRLYSLALALHEWDSCAASALVKTQILTDNIPQAGERGNAFYLAFLAHDQVAVKRICAEIVQSWKQR